DWINLMNKEHVQEDSDPCAIPQAGPRSSFHSLAGAYVLGTINPELYKFPEDSSETDFPEGNIGRLWFSIEYKQESERLLVSLIKLRKLQPPNDSCSAFVKIYLLPDERKYLQSKTKRKPLNPRFDENFVFQVSSKVLLQRTLKFLIYHVDKQKQHHFLGQVIFPLKNETLTDNNKLVIWRHLEKEKLEPPSEYGYIQFSLSYKDYLSRLTIVVLRAKGLKLQEESHAFGKCGFLSAISSRNPMKGRPRNVRSRMESKNTSAPFNSSLFSPETYLLGLVVVGSFMYAHGKELEHWNEIISKPKELVKCWHALCHST
ncbi:SYT15 protein, partial [Piaya cayana]|nr:SYT15 protein [Piaya cayana]